jgi:hypothetical protein
MDDTICLDMIWEKYNNIIYTTIDLKCQPMIGDQIMSHHLFEFVSILKILLLLLLLIIMGLMGNTFKSNSLYRPNLIILSLELYNLFQK